MTRLAYGRQAASDDESLADWLLRISGAAPITSATDIHVDGDPRPDLDAQAATAISAWADVDTDLDSLTGCYCGRCMPPQHPPMPAEACTELGADTAPPRLGLLRRAHIALLQRRHAIVIDERERYAALGAIGPVYELNSRRIELQLMARIRELQGLPPLTTGAPQ